MSGGEQQMLTIARSLMGNPSLLMLDEPSEGLAPKIVEDMAHAILVLKREGLSILMSEQNMHFARLISDRPSSSNADRSALPAPWPRSRRSPKSPKRFSRCDRLLQAPSTSGTATAGGVLRLRPVRTMPSIMTIPIPGRSPS